ncbi:MAG TPA: BamA/TamA family outer membrane protein [Gemmatimonadales bacterium]|nr:BamA/TamA family outer membrane protein [Gemmatimonadales bacterium]
MLAIMAGAPSLASQGVWTNTLYPYAYAAGDGFWLAGHFSEYASLGFAPGPEPNVAALNLDAGGSTQGSYFLTADFQAPAYWQGWRVGLTLGAIRENRLGFFGLGNASVNAADSVGPTSPYFDKVSRTRQSARLTVQRKLPWHFRALVGGQIVHTSFRALPGQSVFAENLASGLIDSTKNPFTDPSVRAGLVFDTRDVESVPESGLFLEALYSAGKGYNRRTASAKVYVSPVERLVLSARLAAEAMGGHPPLAAELAMESSEQSYVAVGGYHSLRGYYDARFTGPGKLLGGLEARYGLLWAPTLFELDLAAFYDAGRVFDEGTPVSLTTKGLHKSAGLELGLRFGRNSVMTVGYGHGSDGGRVTFGTQWSY